MIIFWLFFVAILAFLIGLLVGVRKEPPIKACKFVKNSDEELSNLKKEYENFLNYDGSIQL